MREKMQHNSDRDVMSLYLAALFFVLVLLGCTCGSEGEKKKGASDNTSPYADVAKPSADASVAPSKSGEPDAATTPAQEVQEPAVVEPVEVAPPAAPEPPAQPASPWVYDVKIDKMNDTRMVFAYSLSLQTVDFGFPYNGEQHMRILVRGQSNKKIDAVVFILEKGHFLCSSWDGCTASVRIDGGKPFKVRMVGPSDHSTTALFVGNESSFFKKIMSAKKLLIAFEFYNEGTRLFEFNVEGLSLDSAN